MHRDPASVNAGYGLRLLQRSIPVRTVQVELRKTGVRFPPSPPRSERKDGLVCKGSSFPRFTARTDSTDSTDYDSLKGL